MRSSWNLEVIILKRAPNTYVANTQVLSTLRWTELLTWPPTACNCETGSGNKLTVLHRRNIQVMTHHRQRQLKYGNVDFKFLGYFTTMCQLHRAHSRELNGKANTNNEKIWAARRQLCPLQIIIRHSSRYIYIYIYIYIYRICACVSRTFLARFYPPKLGCSFIHEILKPRSSEKKPLPYRRLSPWRRYCVLWNP
jgi:hypothetical protein